MVFISWNVNGLRACMKKGFADFYQGRRPDFLCLQETKMEQGQADIPLGDGEKQGKLQNAVVRPALHAAGEKFLLHPAPVAGVARFSHVSPPLRTGPGRPPCGLFAPGRPELR